MTQLVEIFIGASKDPFKWNGVLLQPPLNEVFKIQKFEILPNYLTL